MDGDRATGTTEEIGKDGDRPILCVVTATCKTVDDKEALKPPPPLDTVEVQRQFNARILKFSQLYCKGTSKFVGGLAASATCPSVDECRDQVLFNYFTPGMAPTLEVPINVNNPDAKLKSETEGER